MLIQKHYPKIIFSGLLLTVIISVILGWNSRAIWGFSIIEVLILTLFFLHLIFNKEKTVKPFPKILLLWLFILGISTITSIYIYNSLIDFLRYIVYLVGFWLSWHYIDTMRKIKIYYFVLLCMGFLATLYGLLDFQNLKILEVGIGSFFYWKNVYASFLVLILPMVFLFYLTSKKNLQTFILLFLMLLMLVNLFFTNSQAGWLIFIVIALSTTVLLFIILPQNRKKIITRIALLAFLTIITFWGFLKYHYLLFPVQDKTLAKQDFARTTTLQQSSIESRIIYWQNSIKIFQNYPIFGVGLKNFSIIYPHYFTKLWTSTSSPHNYIFLLLTTTGIFSALLFLVFLLFVFVKIIHTFLSHCRDKALNEEKFIFFIGLCASVVSILFFSFVDVTFEVPTLLYLWWIGLGILFGFLYSNISTPNTIYTKITLSIFTIICLTLVFLFILSENFYLQAKELENNPESISQRLDLLQKAKKIMPLSSEINEKLSQVYWDMVILKIGEGSDNMKKALDYAIKAEALNPQSAHYQYFLGYMYFLTQTQGTKNWPKVIYYLKKAIEFDFHDPVYYHTLAIVYYHLNQKQKALETIQTILDIYTQKEIEKIVIGYEIYENFGLKEKLQGLVRLKEFIKSGKLDK